MVRLLAEGETCGDVGGHFVADPYGGHPFAIYVLGHGLATVEGHMCGRCGIWFIRSTSDPGLDWMVGLNVPSSYHVASGEVTG